MAKSNSFFGLRRGSTKSLTFQVLDGKQITKDRVTSVRNPKSNGQIMQRMKFAAVQTILRYYRPYIERGQQGVTYGKKSRNAWLSRVLAGEQLYTNKGNTNILPWQFPLTNGSLTPFEYDYDGYCENLKFPYSSTPDTYETLQDATIIANNPQLAEGDQIAVVVMADIDGTYFISHASHILNGETTLYADMQAKGISLNEMTRGYEPDEDEEDERYNILAFQPTNGAIVGCAVILSRLNGGVFERSTQEFKTQYTPTSAFKDACIDSYRDASQTSTDWPEIIEGGFVPLRRSFIKVQANSEATPELLATVIGFSGSTLKTLLVTRDGTLNQQVTIDGQVESNAAYSYPNLQESASISGLAEYGMIGDISTSPLRYVDGAISIDLASQV